MFNNKPLLVFPPIPLTLPWSQMLVAHPQTGNFKVQNLHTHFRLEQLK